MKIFNTDDEATHHCKMLVYGESGVGKTYLFSTVPDVSTAFLISAEAGTLSLRGKNITCCNATSMSDVTEAYAWLVGSEEARGINFIGLDSISEVGDLCLSEEQEKTKDGRQAYGNTQKRMRNLIKSFQDMPGKHVYMSARQARVQDDAQQMFYGADMPGLKLGPKMSYWFDEVFSLRKFRVEKEGGAHEIKRALQTVSDGQYIAKDRSGRLEDFEAPDLNEILNKILK